MNFREANINDLQALLELEQCVIDAERPFNSSIKSGKTSYYDLHSLIASNDAHVIVLEDSAGIIATGYAQLRTSKMSLDHDIHSYMGFMYVIPEHRGKGINQQIMEMLISWSHEKGVNDFYLDVYSQNAQAIKAYEKIGFEPCLLEMKLNLVR